jgi:hypothetical protein
MSNKIKKIKQNAIRYNELNDRIKEEYTKSPDSEAHRSACKVFCDNSDLLSFPGGYGQAIERLLKQDTSVINDVIDYLIADVYVDQSGYRKQELLLRLKRLTFSNKQKKALGDLLLRSVDNPPWMHSIYYARLAPYIYTPNLIIELQKRAKGCGDPNSNRRQAQHALNLIQMSSNKT